MAEKADKDGLRPLDFVYTGQRLTGKGERAISIRIIQDDGSLSDERWFKYTRKGDRTVGAIYRGAMFSETSAQGLDSPATVYTGRWHAEQQRIEWVARNEATEASLRLKTMEAETGRSSDLERALMAARKAYDGMRKRYDKAGMAALEQAVLAALRAPLRKTEQ